MVESKGFPLTLYEMLEDVSTDERSHIVSWQPHGRCFVVRRRQLFVEQVMPLYFRTSKFASFQRQLNLYGFRRITNGHDKGGYYHERFLQSRRELCRTILRQKAGRKRAPDAAEPEPNFYAMDIMDDLACVSQGMPSNGPPNTISNSIARNVMPIQSAMTESQPMGLSSAAALFPPSQTQASSSVNAGLSIHEQLILANFNMGIWPSALHASNVTEDFVGHRQSNRTTPLTSPMFHIGGQDLQHLTSFTASRVPISNIAHSLSAELAQNYPPMIGTRPDAAVAFFDPTVLLRAGPQTLPPSLIMRDMQDVNIYSNSQRQALQQSQFFDACLAPLQSELEESNSTTAFQRN